jgi:hypothetical protein
MKEKAVDAVKGAEEKVEAMASEAMSGVASLFGMGKKKSPSTSPRSKSPTGSPKPPEVEPPKDPQTAPESSMTDQKATSSLGKAEAAVAGAFSGLTSMLHSSSSAQAKPEAKPEAKPDKLPRGSTSPRGNTSGTSPKASGQSPRSKSKGSTSGPSPKAKAEQKSDPASEEHQSMMAKAEESATSLLSGITSMLHKEAQSAPKAKATSPRGSLTSTKTDTASMMETTQMVGTTQSVSSTATAEVEPPKAELSGFAHLLGMDAPGPSSKSAQKSTDVGVLSTMKPDTDDDARSNAASNASTEKAEPSPVFSEKQEEDAPAEKQSWFGGIKKGLGHALHMDR